MLAPPVPFHRLLTGQLDEIPLLASELSQWAQASYIPARAIVRMNLVLDELITNIISHGYAFTGGAIDVVGEYEGNHWTMTLTDFAVPYDPLQAVEPDTTLSLEEREIGGLGVMFVRRMTDHLAYQRVDVRGQPANQLRISKRIDTPK